MLNQPEISFLSPEWMEVRRWLESELENGYKRLASPSLEDKETQQYRGRVILLRQLLDFSNAPPAAQKRP